jgi:hypothetical protein
MRQIWFFPLRAQIDPHQQNFGRSVGRVLQHEDMLHDQQDNQEWWTPVSV